jgi:radical SAM protein with 4Fe4S-binding SPASM domain
LPVSAGNVRTDDVVDVYRNSALFAGLRRPSEFHGRCGACRFHSMCGGSRARAWAATGDLFAEDPLCPYQP